MGGTDTVTHYPTYEVGEGISLTELGVLWPVVESHGKCGCGAVEMKSTIAYFVSKDLAVLFAFKSNSASAFSKP